MEHKRSHNQDTTEQDFEDLLKGLVIVLAEICAHEYINSKSRETDHVKQPENPKTR